MNTYDNESDINDDNDNCDFSGVESLIKGINPALLKSAGSRVYKTVLGKVEKALIEAALDRTFGNQLKAAKLLGLNRNTLRTKIRKLDVNVNKWKI
jgi:DNA-binding protein Fis